MIVFWKIEKLLLIPFGLLLLFLSYSKTEELNPDDLNEEQVPGEQYYREAEVAAGYSASSVNAVVFRRNSLVTFEDSQYIAFYNGSEKVIIGKRQLGSDKWVVNQTERIYTTETIIWFGSMNNYSY